MYRLLLAITLGICLMERIWGTPTPLASDLASYYEEERTVWLRTGNDEFLGIQRLPSGDKRGEVLLVADDAGNPAKLDRDFGAALSRKGWHSLSIRLPTGPTPALAEAAATQRIRFAVEFLGKDAGHPLFILCTGGALASVLAAATSPLAHPLRGLVWISPDSRTDTGLLDRAGLPLLAITTRRPTADPGPRTGIEHLNLPPGTSARWQAGRIGAWMQRIARSTSHRSGTTPIEPSVR